MGAFDTHGLPTRRRDRQLMNRTVRLILSVPWYAALALVYAVLTLSVFVFVSILNILQ